MVDLVPSVDPIPPLRNVKVTDPAPSLVSPTLPLKSAKVVYPIPPLVDLIQSSVDPTLLLESKPNTAHVFLVHTDSTILGAFLLLQWNPLQVMKPSFFIGVC